MEGGFAPLQCRPYLSMPPVFPLPCFFASFLFSRLPPFSAKPDPMEHGCCTCYPPSTRLVAASAISGRIFGVLLLQCKQNLYVLSWASCFLPVLPFRVGGFGLVWVLGGPCMLGLHLVGKCYSQFSVCQVLGFPLHFPETHSL